MESRAAHARLFCLGPGSAGFQVLDRSSLLNLLALFPMRMLRVYTGLAAETHLEQGDAAPPASGSSPGGGPHHGGRRADSRHLRRLSYRGPANRHPFYLAG